jgi:hypothetical protein
VYYNNALFETKYLLFTMPICALPCLYNGRMAANNLDVEGGFVFAANMDPGAAAVGQPADPTVVDLDGEQVRI